MKESNHNRPRDNIKANQRTGKLKIMSKFEEEEEIRVFIVPTLELLKIGKIFFKLSMAKDHSSLYSTVAVVVVGAL